MKKMTKRVAGLALSAALALMVGAGVYSVVNAYDQPTVTASAATVTKDLSSTIYTLNQHYNGDWGTCGDFKEAGLYRFWISTDKTLAWNDGGSCLNESGRDHLLDYIKVNGKTVAEWRTAYANGETKPITWEGMPGNTGGGKAMHVNIANDVANNTAVYAPIMINLAHHKDGNGNSLGSALDMYIPTSFMSEVHSIEFLKGFEWSYGGEVFGFSEDVHFTCNSLALPYKQVGERGLTVKETTVTSVDGSYGKKTADGKIDQFLSFYLSENDYDTANTVAVADKDFLRSINFFDYILLDGEKMGSLWVNSNNKFENPAEQFFNVWNRIGSFGLRWPCKLSNSGKTDSVQEIKILAGCQFPSKTDANTVYEVKEDVTFIRQESGAFADPSSLIGADDVAISWTTVAGDAKELYRVNITCADWTYNLGAGNDAYDLNYFEASRVTLRQNIYINDKSVYEINTTVDDSEYVYSTFPSDTNTLTQTSPIDGKDYDVFKNPVLMYVSGNILSLYIHKDYVESLCKDFGDTMKITVKKEISNSTKIQGKVLKEDVTAVAYGIGYNLDLMDGETKVETMSIIAGEPLNNLPTLIEEHKIFRGWVDAEGNPAPATMPEGNYTLYAKWEIIPYTLTIVYMDNTTKTFTFGVDCDTENGIELTVDDLANVLEENLPQATEEFGYGYAEKIPTPFKGENYTFTVITVKTVFTITFTDAEGNDIGVAPVTFTAKTIDDLVLPAVPEKEGFKGAWNKTTDRLKLEDVTLYAVYTEVKEEVPSTPSKPSDSTLSSDNDSVIDSVQPGAGNLLAGCSGVVGGAFGMVAAFGVAAVALLKKKEN